MLCWISEYAYLFVSFLQTICQKLCSAEWVNMVTYLFPVCREFATATTVVLCESHTLPVALLRHVGKWIPFGRMHQWNVRLPEMNRKLSRHKDWDKPEVVSRHKNWRRWRRLQIEVINSTAAIYIQCIYIYISIIIHYNSCVVPDTIVYAFKNRSNFLILNLWRSKYVKRFTIVCTVNMQINSKKCKSVQFVHPILTSLSFE